MLSPPPKKKLAMLDQINGHLEHHLLLHSGQSKAHERLTRGNGGPCSLLLLHHSTGIQNQKKMCFFKDSFKRQNTNVPLLF